MKKELKKAIAEQIAKGINFNNISLSKKDYPDSEILMSCLECLDKRSEFNQIFN